MVKQSWGGDVCPCMRVLCVYICGCAIQVSMVVDELLVNVEEVMFVGHYGVLVSLVSACVHCPEKQSSVMQMLLRVFHVEQSPKQLLKVILSLTTLEVYQESKDREVLCTFTSFTGTYTLSSFCLFSSPSIYLSLCTMYLNEFVSITCIKPK